MTAAPTPSCLATVRQLVPHRPLRYREALVIAERQAGRCRQLLGVHDPAFPDEAFDRLPRLEIALDADLPVSAASHWQWGRWIITLNAAEPYRRRRFSAAHELAHILWHPHQHYLHPGGPLLPAPQAAEALADYFAGCLLMPKIHLRAAWTSGVQRPSELAELFEVSVPAIEVRLAQLGLTSARARCLPELRAPRSGLAFRRPGTYHRQLAPAYARPLVAEGVTG